MVLVGTKCDLRSDPDALQRLEARHLAPTSFDQGARLAQQIGAFCYVECAATVEGGLLQLNDLLDVLVSGDSKKKKKGKSKHSSSSPTAQGKAQSACCQII